MDEIKDIFIVDKENFLT